MVEKHLDEGLRKNKEYSYRSNSNMWPPEYEAEC